MSRYFGEPYPSRSWPAPIYEDSYEIPTPVGEICYLCEEVIAEGERGFERMMVTMDGPKVGYVHHECDLRSVVGSVAHQRGECGCMTGDFSGHDDEEYPTRREAARAAVREFEKRGIK